MGEIKSYLGFGLLFLILGLSATNTFWPQTPKLSQESLERIDAALTQWERFAVKMEENTRSVTTLNQLMHAQVRARQDENDAGYNKLLQQYGYDVGESSPDINLRMFNEPQNLRRGDVSGGPKQGNPDPAYPTADPGSEAKVDPGQPKTSDPGNNTPAGRPW